ncbi:MAG: aminomethyl-transferring glycine dehydrogenase subunit GcvPA [Cyanobacteria bacterium HKST-UBA03]|nr:aminomethyl-transferring glycine dehydrogenase subunit GcvPA [Cyanobacteria bacterium HKST-UBA03]
MTGFLPHTPDEVEAMLDAIGVDSIDALFSAIPPQLQGLCQFDVMPASGLDELGLQQFFKQFTEANLAHHYDCFVGGGAYNRFVPPAVNHIASRSEFYTAYTPYQPEVSQGTLQMIYEFQTMVSELVGLDVTNASVYDGASAFSESAVMAVRIAKKRHTLLVSKTVNPHYRVVLDTYTGVLDHINVVPVDLTADLEAQCCAVGVPPNQVAAVLVQLPNYLGFLEDQAMVTAFCKAHGALKVAAVDPVALGVMAAPGKSEANPDGADIVCGELQQFGNYVNFGGPYGGFVSTSMAHVRQLPGRLVGCSKDRTGKRAYTLTMQTREQHIRRAKATSNICTNQSLNILKASAYLSLVGPSGLKHLALLSAQRAHRLADQLCRMTGVSLLSAAPYLNEFTLTLPVAAQAVVESMVANHGLVPGIPLSRYESYFPNQPHALVVAVTEMNTPESLDRYVYALHHALTQLGAQPGPEPRMPAPAASGLPKSVMSRSVPSQHVPNHKGVVQHV